MNHSAIAKMLAIFVIGGVTACGLIPPRPDISPDCVRFEILDTLRVGDAIHIRTDTPTLEVLPIGQRDIVSSELRGKRDSILQYEPGFKPIETWAVDVSFNPKGTKVLADATSRNINRQLRISRPGFPTIEPIIKDPTEAGKVVIDVHSESEAQQVVTMLGTSCR